jgi:hypothetical protein
MNLRRVLLVLFLGLLSACRITVTGPLPEHAGPDVQRDAGYALLLGTLDEESRVAGLLSIKTVPDETSALVRRIASSSSQDASRLKSLVDAPPAVRWDRNGLPAPELEARAWIANRTTIALLGSSGRRLEVDIILSQLQASEYIAAIATALSKKEPSEARRSELDRIRLDYTALHTAFRVRLQALTAKAPPVDEGSGSTG